LFEKRERKKKGKRTASFTEVSGRVGEALLEEGVKRKKKKRGPLTGMFGGGKKGPGKVLKSRGGGEGRALNARGK